MQLVFINPAVIFNGLFWQRLLVPWWIMAFSTDAFKVISHTCHKTYCILSPLMPKFRKRINKNLSKISLHLSEFVIIESPISTNRTGMYLLKVNNKGCLAHILLGPFLNTLSYMWHHIFSVSLYDKEKKPVDKEFITRTRMYSPIIIIIWTVYHYIIFMFYVRCRCRE